jgi:carbonic anhydrase
VAGQIARGKLDVIGWVYDIGKGIVYAHEGKSNEFHPLSEEGDE